MSTNLTTPTRNLPTTREAHLAIEGMEGLTQRDVILPRWSIVQPTSKFDGADQHVGHFRRNLDAEFRPALEVVPVMIQATRLLWSGDLDDKAPECVSRDTVVGSVYGACDSCQFNIQVNRDLAARIKAKEPVKVCSYGYTLVVIDDLTEMTPALIGAMGTSVKPIRNVIAQLALKRRAPFSSVLRLETEKVTNDRGKFYVLKPSLRWLDADETATYRAVYQEYHGVTIHDVDEAVEDDAPLF